MHEQPMADVGENSEKTNRDGCMGDESISCLISSIPSVRVLTPTLGVCLARSVRGKELLPDRHASEFLHSLVRLRLSFLLKEPLQARHGVVAVGGVPEEGQKEGDELGELMNAHRGTVGEGKASCQQRPALVQQGLAPLRHMYSDHLMIMDVQVGGEQEGVCEEEMHFFRGNAPKAEVGNFQNSRPLALFVVEKNDHDDDEKEGISVDPVSEEEMDGLANDVKVVILLVEQIGPENAHEEQRDALLRKWFVTLHHISQLR